MTSKSSTDPTVAFQLRIMQLEKHLEQSNDRVRASDLYRTKQSDLAGFWRNDGTLACDISAVVKFLVY